MMNNMQDEFIATVSHELRTPLTSIRGFSQTLLNSWDKIDDENKKKFIKIIEDQSNRLIHLVENVLSVSKMHAGSEVLKKINVNEAISKLIPLFTEQYKTRHFELELEKHLPPARLDEDKFQQVMTNLIDNAAKYSVNGKTVLVSTGISENMILIKVKDEGVGIKKRIEIKFLKNSAGLRTILQAPHRVTGWDFILLNSL